MRMKFCRRIALACFWIFCIQGWILAQCFPHIAALNSACLGDSSWYVADTGSTKTWNWSVAGGNIISGQTDDTVLVIWTQPGAATISVIVSDTATSCSDNQTFNEFVVSVLINEISGDNPAVICIGSDPVLYWNCYQSPPGGGEHSGSWFVQGGIMLPSGNDTASPFLVSDTVSVIWNPTGPHSIAWTLTHDFSGCFSSDTTSITQSAKPVVDFCLDATLNPVSFSSKSTYNSGASFLWDFGDGGTASIENPLHSYTLPGIYQVCLTVADLCGSDSTCHFVSTSCSAPSAGFTIIPSGLIVFFSSSVSTATSWSWDFGDGSGSTFANPLHTFLNPGTYQVCMMAENSCGCQEFCSPVSVSCGVPSASFNATVTQLEASFVNSATGGGTHLWNFGDGGNSTDSDPVHSYLTQGVYSVCLYTWNGCGADSVCQNVNVVCPPPAVAFSDTLNYYTASFTDNSTNGGFIEWDFGDGTSDSVANPVHVFATTGTYQVCLIQTNACGKDTVCKNIVISCPVPVSGYTFTSSLKTLFFNDLSTMNPDTWFWDFGDGTTDTATNPAHTFPSGGNYVVCLTVSNFCGTDSFCDTLTVSCPVPVSNWTQTSNLLAFNFTNLSTGSPTSFLWDFGDGNSSALQNPSHTYLAPGIQIVCLSVSSVCGTDTSCQSVNPTCPVPAANWGYTENNLTAAFADSSSGATSWAWDFGDGGSSNVQNPVHGYLAFGSYNVCLIVSNSCGKDTFCQNVLVFCPSPLAGFTYSKVLFTVSFTDTSTGGTSWLWDFGDGNISVQQNPMHTYTAQNMYSVCLTVLNSCGNSQVCKNVEVTCPFPVPGFSYSVSGLTVTFTDTTNSNFPTFWQWDFGDGDTSWQQNPVHTYDSSVYFYVCLSIQDSCGTNTNCDSILVVSSDQIANRGQVRLYPVPAQDKLQIEWSGVLEIRAISVWDVLGRRADGLDWFEMQSGVEMSMENLSNGYYLVELLFSEGTIVKKLVVTK